MIGDPVIILVPPEVKSNMEGYQWLLSCHARMKDLHFRDIMYDFKAAKWFDANLFAVFGSILSEARTFNTVKFMDISFALRKTMLQSRFLKSPNSEDAPMRYKTSIEYTKTPASEDESFCRHIETNLLSRNELPKMSPLLIKRIKQALVEIFINAKAHGCAQYVFSDGQYYHQKQRLSFTIADIGTTIKENVSTFLGKPMTGEAAIEWAVQPNNTTRPRAAGVPGGLGLSLLRAFVAKNGGRMQIVSADGYWEQCESKVALGVFVGEFPGALVSFEFKLVDTVCYCLAEELKGQQ